MRERRTYGSVRGLRREPLVYSTAGLTNLKLCEKSLRSAIVQPPKIRYNIVR